MLPPKASATTTVPRLSASLEEATMQLRTHIRILLLIATHLHLRH